MKPEKKQIWLLTLPAIVLFFALPLKAQVTVGKDSVPHSFSILELATDIERGGLRLPQFTTGGRESNLTPQLTDSLSEGLTIFNSEANCLEFWNGTRWVSLCDNTTTTVTPLAQPGSITGATDVCPSGTQTYSVGAVTGATSYVWTLPDGWTSATGTTTTTPSITVTPDLPSSITLNTSLSQLVVGGTVSVTANGASGAVSPASVLSVTTYNGCCAYISATEWKVFDCYNVGANQAANPLIPSADLNGDYYQWGSLTPAAYGPANGDAINGGTWSSTAPAIYYYYGDNTNATNITAKSLTDPCPDGYRVPSSDEWNGMITYNTKTNPGTWITNNWSGSMFGRALLLPAAGYRIAADGSLGNRGINGYYWSNRVNDSTSAYLLNFASGFANVTLGNYTRANGLSVRCIAE